MSNVETRVLQSAISVAWIGNAKQADETFVIVEVLICPLQVYDALCSRIFNLCLLKAYCYRTNDHMRALAIEFVNSSFDT